MVVRADARLTPASWTPLPEMLAFGALGASMAVGVSWSLLNFGSGMLVGMRINARVDSGDFPMRWVVIGIAASVAVVIVQKTVLHMPVWMTLVALVLSIPLMLVGLRVLGETNWDPISALSNMMQAIFGVIAPGMIAPNIVSSGVTGSVAIQSEGLMQDYKAGAIIGSTPRFLTYAQLMAIPVGAGAVSIVYPLLRDTYGIGGDHGLSSPISQKWAPDSRTFLATVRHDACLFLCRCVFPLPFPFDRHTTTSSTCWSRRSRSSGSLVTMG